MSIIQSLEIRISSIGVLRMNTNATNPALQLLNQRIWNEEEAEEVDTGNGLEISSSFAHHIKAVLLISASSTSDSTSRTEIDYHADSPVVGKNAMIFKKKWDDS